MGDFANPAWISEFALGLSEPGYMKSWGSYTTDAPFAWSASRLADVRALGERLAGARDALRPKDPEEGV